MALEGGIYAVFIVWKLFYFNYASFHIHPHVGNFICIMKNRKYKLLIMKSAGYQQPPSTINLFFFSPTPLLFSLHILILLTSFQWNEGPSNYCLSLFHDHNRPSMVMSRGQNLLQSPTQKEDTSQTAKVKIKKVHCISIRAFCHHKALDANRSL